MIDCSPQRPAPGFYDTTDERKRTQALADNNVTEFIGKDVASLGNVTRMAEEEKKRKFDQKRGMFVFVANEWMC